MKKKNYYYKRKKLCYNYKAVNFISNIKVKKNYKIYYVNSINLNLRKKELKNKYLKLIKK